MTTLLKLARTPAVVVSRQTRVMEAVCTMLDHGVGAVAVVETGNLVGIFTERDVLARVMRADRPPHATMVGDVMTCPVIKIDQDADPHVAQRLMLTNHVRHLPVVDGSGKLRGMLSLRHLLRDEIDDLEHAVDSLADYASTDSIGG